MSDPDFHAAAAEFLAVLHSEAAAQAMDEANGWAVVIQDKETGKISLTGSFEQPAAALAEAELVEQQLHKNLPEGEAGWKVTVLPLDPPESREPRPARESVADDVAEAEPLASDEPLPKERRDRLIRALGERLGWSEEKIQDVIRERDEQ